MAMFASVLLVLQIISAFGVIVLVLLQHGKGADMGAAFGSGASGSLFGATGSANFLSRLTGGCAAAFFVTTLGLSYLANSGLVARSSGGELEKRLSAPTAPVVPAAGGVPTAPVAPAAGSAPAPAAAPATPATAPAKSEVPAKAAGQASEIPK
jgi:preprotein translocase subunit SecG